jgi:hypothetical protein
MFAKFYLTCSHRLLFDCLVSVKHLSVAAEYPHLQAKVPRMFSKNPVPRFTMIVAMI